MVSDFIMISESKKPLPFENGTLIECNSRVPCENGKLISCDSRMAVDFRLFAVKCVIQIRHCLGDGLKMDKQRPGLKKTLVQ